MNKVLSMSVMLLSLVACKNNLDTSEETVKVSKYDVNFFSMNKLVCDPFQSNNPDPLTGLKAKLYTMPNGETPNNLDTFYNSGVISDKDLFFSEVNVPTRVFSLGFPTETGEMIKADDGGDLVEWFALRMESVLKLAPEDEEGTYELALLADDGSRLSIKNSDGVYEIAVDNDGLHPTRMGCGDTITMTKDSKLSVQIDYFQGPRWHISVIPMWRKVTESTLAEPRCGQLGNSLFFDYNNNSEPQPAYNELLSRGWKPIAAANWEIEGSNQGEYNPCSEGEGLTISGFAINALGEGAVDVVWSTDKVATSQLIIKNLVTNNEITTESDNVLRTEHSIVMSLSPGIPYEITAISVGEDLSKAMSETVIYTP